MDSCSRRGCGYRVTILTGGSAMQQSEWQAEVSFRDGIPRLMMRRKVIGKKEEREPRQAEHEKDISAEARSLERCPISMHRRIGNCRPCCGGYISETRMAGRL